MSENSIHTGFRIQRGYYFLSDREKSQERQRLKIPTNDTVIISVGALNEIIKRMKYEISEVSMLENDPFLILIGQLDHETKDVIKSANVHLKNGNFLVDSVPQSDVDQYFKIADIFHLHH